MKRLQVIAALVLGALVALPAFPGVASSQTVGSAAAVKPSSSGTPPGGATRTLQVGTGIVSKERIKTTNTGSLQVMFVDKTTLTIGPNSDLVIDDFVFRNDGSAGSFTASLATGALRFVGGQVSHTVGATINTPVATIAIRGGAAIITLDAECLTRAGASGRGAEKCAQVACTGGTCLVTSLIDSRNLQLRIGQAVEISAIGITQPFDASSVRLNSVVGGGQALTAGGKPGAAGGQTNFTGQSAIDQLIYEQAPEPVAPPP
jgi:hypothetical protein